MLNIATYPAGFEEDHRLRSAFVRNLTLHLSARPAASSIVRSIRSVGMPRTLIRYWHDPHDIPVDVRACLASWERLRQEGFEIRTFDDESAAMYIAQRYNKRHLDAFQRCRHPAMRSDYLRLCFVVSEGGFYVDADDVLIGDGWRTIFLNGALKLQPLCYDVSSSGMIPAPQIWRSDLLTDDRIFYVNNNPFAAPAAHPALQRALRRATGKLLGDNPHPEIQETTGPGNLTAALVAHARDLVLAGAPLDFELMHDWDAIAETRWDLGYRSDARNWRNMGP